MAMLCKLYTPLRFSGFCNIQLYNMTKHVFLTRLKSNTKREKWNCSFLVAK